MNILIVDDQKVITDSLCRELDWERIGISQTFTANSAMEAKLVLMNFDIDILMTDIEMPEEDGIALFRWVHERSPHIVGIFLTSHADFAYAKEALRLGGFDYILQPARPEEVEQTVRRAMEEAKKNVRIRRLEHASKIIGEQRDGALELLIARQLQEDYAACDETFERMKRLFGTRFEQVVFYPLWIQVMQSEKHQEKWDDDLFKLVFRNVLEELYEPEAARACIARWDFQGFFVLIAVDDHVMKEERWRQGLAQFTQFFNSRMEFKVAVYAGEMPLHSYRAGLGESLKKYRFSNQADNRPGLIWQEEEPDSVPDENVERFRMAEDYIRANINRRLSRTEVAEHLHISEEHFSRMFKRQTGYTFKEFDNQIRMEMAKKLLGQTHLSISIIASKVGYDNFSHFSKAFKKYTDQTPQEYRKQKITK